MVSAALTFNNSISCQWLTSHLISLSINIFLIFSLPPFRILCTCLEIFSPRHLSLSHRRVYVECHHLQFSVPLITMYLRGLLDYCHVFGRFKGSDACSRLLMTSFHSDINEILMPFVITQTLLYRKDSKDLFQFKGSS